MQYRKLGKKGPLVSTIGFGAWGISGNHWGKTDDATSIEALHAALDAGVTFIDTADVYGFGHSEELIAKVFREREKGDVVIATKAGSDFYNATAEDDDGFGSVRPNYTKTYLISAAEKSLKRLNLETLDILQLHSPELSLLEMDDPWLALEQLKKEGKIRYAGLSILSFKENEQAHLLDAHHDLLDCIQVRYNLLERQAEDTLFPKAMMYGTGVIVRIPILFGLLTGKFSRESTFGDDDHRSISLSPEKIAHYFDELQKRESLFASYPDQSMAQVSLRFCLSHPACHTVIPGAKTARQVTENCSSSDLGPL
ncbi:aldo/keto reductase [bacterium]|nr:aldo/keto reductase [bacterium]